MVSLIAESDSSFFLREKNVKQLEKDSNRKTKNFIDVACNHNSDCRRNRGGRFTQGSGRNDNNDFQSSNSCQNTAVSAAENDISGEARGNF